MTLKTVGLSKTRQTQILILKVSKWVFNLMDACNSVTRGRKHIGSTLSYPVFIPKPCTHRMYAHDQLFHTYGQKVFTDNQMS
jgi:hypothetical protein